MMLGASPFQQLLLLEPHMPNLPTRRVQKGAIVAILPCLHVVK
jgi:hypothetical protein